MPDGARARGGIVGLFIATGGGKLRHGGESNMVLAIDQDSLAKMATSWWITNAVLPVVHEGRLHLAFAGARDDRAASWAAWRLDLPAPEIPVLEGCDEDLAHPMAVLRGQEASDHRGGLLGAGVHDGGDSTACRP